ncbi:DUF7537 family lipoprotein [Halonotius sp. GCM10025705]|uniref:DUF7537 family lipoprotein n=1 Tax=Halonotius sp. GCM10025705 TaxID=3252678 RepID=UPI003619FCB0
MVNRVRGPRSVMLLAVVLILAGCTGSPTPEQQSPAPEATVENVSYPSGWSQEGIADIGTAIQTHKTTVQNTSRTSRLSTVDDDSNRTVVRTLDTDAGAASIRWTDTLFGSDEHYYYTAEGVFEYDRTTGELSRNPDENWTPSRVASQEGLEQPLVALELNATRTVTVAETTAVRYRVTGFKDPDSVPFDTASGQITVSEAGFIAEYNITRASEGNTRQTRYDLSAVGTATVNRPAWLPDGEM